MIQPMGQQAVCYYRVSSEEQAKEGVSLEAQEQRLLAYCALMGLSPVAMIREAGVSAGKPLSTRTGGAELLRLIHTKQVQHVVALKLDRLFRDTEECLHQTKRWDKAGVALHLVDMGGQTLNTASAMGRMFLTMAAGFAELERNLVAERTAAAIHYKQSQHEYIGGDLPFGWQLAADGVHLEPRPVSKP